MGNYIDLHIHSKYSDGTFAPSKIIDKAIENGISAISITDHDTIEGIEEAEQYARNKNIEIVPGIEFSTYEDFDIHILGYYINRHSEKLSVYAKQKKRNDLREIMNVLQGIKKKGIRIDLNTILLKYKKVNVKIIVRYLVSEGLVQDSEQAYRICYSLYAEQKRNYEKIITPYECIKFIHDLGGKAVLAHPMLISKDYSVLEKKIKDFKQQGLDGIECIHPKLSLSDRTMCLGWADKFNLCITGGSDFHGRKEDLGEIGYIKSYGKIKYAYLDEIKRSL